MKPRIKIYRYEGKIYWHCKGGDQMDGVGMTPEEAYEDWLAECPF